MFRTCAITVGAMSLWAFTITESAQSGDTLNKELQTLSEKAAQASGKSIAPLRTELLRFGQRHAGTMQAVKAAQLLRDLRSPLDHLDAKNVAALEKFAWMPKETVAVLGEHRGRQAGDVTAVAFSKNG